MGATDSNDVVASFSQVDNDIDVSAPGVYVLSTYRNGDNFYNQQGQLDPNYEYESGTSMATPHVSGVASLLKGYNSSLYNDDIEHIIQLSADKIRPNLYTYDSNGWNINVGYGRVNAYKALDMLRSPYVLQHHTVTGGTDEGSTNAYAMAFFGVPGFADGEYVVKRHLVSTQVNYSYMDSVHVWGDGVATIGASQANPNFGMGWCEPASFDGSAAALNTYVYEVYDVAGNFIGWYPSSPSNVQFTYTVIGIPGTPPPLVSISGPTLLNQGQSGTWTANATGGTAPYTYQWQRSSDNNNWTNVGTSSSYTGSSGSTNFWLRVTVTDHNQQTGSAGTWVQINNGGPLTNPFTGDINTNPKPAKFALQPAYPNPFNPTTTIHYALPEQSNVQLTVYNIMGRKVAQLVNVTQLAGYYQQTFNASNLSSGLYIVQLKAIGHSGKNFNQTIKLMLIK